VHVARILSVKDVMGGEEKEKHERNRMKDGEKKVEDVI